MSHTRSSWQTILRDHHLQKTLRLLALVGVKSLGQFTFCWERGWAFWLSLKQR